MTGRFRPTILHFQKPWHGCVAALVALAAFILVGRWDFGMMRRYPLVRFDTSLGIALLVCLLLVSTVCWVYLWRTGPVSLRARSSLSAGFLVTLLIGLGGYHQLNAILDSARARPGTYLIEGLDCTSDRRHRARLWLRPLDPLNERFTLELPKSECRSSLPSDTVYVDLKPGFFGSQWVAEYRVVRRNR